MDQHESTGHLLEYIQNTSNLQRVKFEETIAMVSAQLAEKQEELITKEAYILELEDSLYALNEENEKLTAKIQQIEIDSKETLQREISALKKAHQEAIAQLTQANQKNVENYNKIILLEKAKHKKRIQTIEASYDLVLSRHNEQAEYIKELENIIMTTLPSAASAASSASSGPSESSALAAALEQEIITKEGENTTVVPPLPPSSTASSSPSSADSSNSAMLFPPLPPAATPKSKKTKTNETKSLQVSSSEIEPIETSNSSAPSATDSSSPAAKSVPAIQTQFPTNSREDDEEFPSPLVITISRNIRRPVGKTKEKPFRSGLLQQYPNNRAGYSGVSKDEVEEEVGEVENYDAQEVDRVSTMPLSSPTLPQQNLPQNLKYSSSSEAKESSPSTSSGSPVKLSSSDSATILSGLSAKKHLSDKISASKPGLGTRFEGKHSLPETAPSSLLDISIDSVRPFDNDSLISDSDLANIVKEMEFSDGIYDRVPSPYSREVQSDTESESGSYVSYNKVYQKNSDRRESYDLDSSIDSYTNPAPTAINSAYDDTLHVHSLDEEESFDVSADFTPMVNWIKSSQQSSRRPQETKDDSPISNRYFSAFED